MFKKMGVFLLALVLIWQAVVPGVVFAGDRMGRDLFVVDEIVIEEDMDSDLDEVYEDSVVGDKYLDIQYDEYPLGYEVEDGKLDEDLLLNDTSVNYSSESELIDEYNDIFLETSGFTTEPMISAGGAHTVALRSDGTVWTWGENANGQLGNASTTNQLTPVQVYGISNVISISAGGTHTVALRSDGTVWAWGGNRSGQLGIGNTTTDQFLPVQTLGISDIISISAAGERTTALRSDGIVFQWGIRAIAGSPHPNGRPNQVLEINDVVSITASNAQTMALRNDGTVWAWGHNYNGQLGIGNRRNTWTPTRVLNLENILTVSTGGSHSIALKSDGTVWHWGWISGVSIGSGWNPDIRTAYKIQDLDNITMVSASGGHAVVLRHDGTVWTWRFNDSGQLGNNTTLRSANPVQVLGEDGVGYLNLGPSTMMPQPPTVIPEDASLSIYDEFLEHTVYFGQEFNLRGGITGSTFDRLPSTGLFEEPTHMNSITITSNVLGSIEVGRVSYDCGRFEDGGGICYPITDLRLDRFDARITPLQTGTFTLTVKTDTGLETEMTLHVVPWMETTFARADLLEGNTVDFFTTIHTDDTASFSQRPSSTISIFGHNIIENFTLYNVDEQGITWRKRVEFTRSGDATLTVASNGLETNDTFRIHSWIEYLQRLAREWESSYLEYLRVFHNELEIEQRRVGENSRTHALINVADRLPSNIISSWGGMPESMQTAARRAFLDAYVGSEAFGRAISFSGIQANDVLNGAGLVNKITQSISHRTIRSRHGHYQVTVSIAGLGTAGFSTVRVQDTRAGGQSHIASFVTDSERIGEVVDDFISEMRKLVEEAVKDAVKYVLNDLSSNLANTFSIATNLPKISLTPDNNRILRDYLNFGDQRSLLRAIDHGNNPFIDVLRRIHSLSTDEEITRWANDFERASRDYRTSLNSGTTRPALQNAELLLRSNVTILRNAISDRSNNQQHRMRNISPRSGSGIGVNIKCPVDIFVYDSENNLIGAIIDNTVTIDSEKIFLSVDGEVKSIYAPVDFDINLRIVATGYGQMNISVERYKNYEIIKRANFFDIYLAQGQEFTFDLSSDLEDLYLHSDENILPSIILSVEQAEMISITVTSEDGGVTSLSNEYVSGEVVNLVAIPNEGFIFEGWFVENELISLRPFYQFLAFEDTIFEAKFIEFTDTTAFVVVAVGDGGTIEGSGLYEVGDEVILIATPNEGYTFDGWYDDTGSLVVSDKEYNFIVNEDIFFEAHFVQEEQSMQIPVTDISITGEATRTLEISESVQLETIITPTNATNQDVTWSSSNPTVATITEDGEVLASSSGTTEITVTTIDGEHTASIIITVVDSTVSTEPDETQPTTVPEATIPETTDPSEPEESMPETTKPTDPDETTPTTVPETTIPEVTDPSIPEPTIPETEPTRPTTPPTETPPKPTEPDTSGGNNAGGDSGNNNRPNLPQTGTAVANTALAGFAIAKIGLVTAFIKNNKRKRF